MSVPLAWRPGAPAHGVERRLAQPPSALLVLVLLAFVLGGLAPEAEASRPRRTRITLNLAELAKPDQESGAEARPAAPMLGTTWDELRHGLGEWKRAVDAGTTSESDDVLNQIQRQMSRVGFKSRTLLLNGFVGMGREWMLSESWDKAERAFGAALTLDSRHAAAHVGKAELLLHRKDFVGVAGSVFMALRSSLASRSGVVHLAARALFISIVASILAVTGFALVLLVKYNRLLRHGLRERLDGRVPDGLDGVIAWAIVLAPVVLFLPPSWWVIYWLVALGGFGARSERILGVLALVVVAALAPAFHAVTWLSALPQNAVFRTMTALEEGNVMPDVVEAFSNHALRDGSDQSQFILAGLLAQAGETSKALELYDAIAERDPKHARAVVNRANIHFRRGDARRAISDYKAASELDRNMLLAFRNGSIAYAQELDTEQATSFSRKAQALDARLVARWRDEVGADVMVDALLSPTEVRALLRESHGRLLPGMLRGLLAPTSLGAIAGAVFLLVRMARPGGILEVRACEKCGRAFSPASQAGARSSSYCTQCIHLYVKKDGVSPEVRTAKLREVEKWLAVNSIAIRLFNLALPGSGGLYANRSLSGGILLVMWSTAIAALLLAPFLPLEPSRIGHFDLSVIFGIELALLVGVYLVALIQSMRH